MGQEGIVCCFSVISSTQQVSRHDEGSIRPPIIVAYRPLSFPHEVRVIAPGAEAPGAFILPPGITFAAWWGYDRESGASRPIFSQHSVVPQYNGHRRVAELKIAGRRVKQR